MSGADQHDRELAYRRVMKELGAELKELPAADATASKWSWLDADALSIELYEYGEVWSRPGLDLRSRAFITIGVLSVLNQFEELELQLHHALNLGIAPDEITETMLHAGVYGGIPGWRRGVAVARRVFEERGVLADRDAPPPQLPMTLVERRAAMQRVLGTLRLRRLGPSEDAGRVTPLPGGHLGILAATQLDAEAELYALQLEQGYGEIWGRKVLDLRTRSFVTVCLLQVLHEDDQLLIHVNNALNNGITADELHEAFAQAGLYGGVSAWHNATHVARHVFLQRGLVDPVDDTHGDATGGHLKEA